MRYLNNLFKTRRFARGKRRPGATTINVQAICLSIQRLEERTVLSASFDPGSGTYTLPYSGSGNYGFIEKLNSAGSLVWVRQVGTGSVRSLALDVAGNVYVQGLFSVQGDFNPGTGTTLLTSQGGTDVFVAKFTDAGTFVWAVSFGGTGNDLSEGIAVDTAGNVHVAGGFYGTVDFDPNPVSTNLITSAGSNDLFLLKLTQS